MEKIALVNDLKQKLAGFKISGQPLRILKILSQAVLIFLAGLCLGLNLSVIIFLVLLFVYLKFIYRNLEAKPFCLLNLSLLFIVLVSLSYAIIHKGLPFYFIPFTMLAMLATILFNELMIAFVLSLAASVAVSSIVFNNLNIAVLFLTSAILSSILVFGARRRITIIRAGVIVGGMQALSLFILEGMRLSDSQSYSYLLANGVVCAILVLGLLPIFEHLFQVITNISLLELADFNQPLLNRLMLEAPGTYHHSLIVGNLSEAACRAIGANSLLARIGAYYHDIGKIEKPDYYSENQEIEAKTKHDALSPTMSKLVIMNHVKEGVDLAKKYRLNPQLIEFIQEHHGNSLVYYFYRRALENLEEEEAVKEEGFRYPGPKPKTKEIAVVLLADSVEAATRSLKDPQAIKIEELVHKVINNKFIDGQLDDCDLTLKDLEKISQVFIRILSGIYHNRISYPEERSENNHKKLSKENSHQSSEDKKDSP